MDEYEQKYKKDWIPIYLMVADDDKIDSIPDYLLYDGWQDVCMSWTSMRPFELYLARTGKLPPPIYFKDIKAVQEKDSYAISTHYHSYTIELLYENKINIRPLKDINNGVYYNLLFLLMCEDIVYKATHYIQQDISFAKENIVHLFKFSCNTGAGVYDVPDIIKYDGWQKQRDEDGLTPIQYILNRCDDLIKCVIRPELYYDGWL